MADKKLLLVHEDGSVTFDGQRWPEAKIGKIEPTKDGFEFTISLLADVLEIAPPEPKQPPEQPAAVPSFDDRVEAIRQRTVQERRQLIRRVAR